MRDHPGMRARDWVAIILAVGIATALNIIVMAVLWTAVTDKSDLPGNAGGLSENATQVITGAFGGIIGVLGSYLGFRTGERRNGIAQADDEQPSFDRRGPSGVQSPPK